MGIKKVLFLSGSISATIMPKMFEMQVKLLVHLQPCLVMDEFQASHAEARTLGFGHDLEALESFRNFESEYRKEYTYEERKLRAGIFHENYKTIQEHNNGDHSWTMGVNEVRF